MFSKSEFTRTLADDRVALTNLLKKNAEISIVAVYIGFFFLRYPSYATASDKKLVENFLSLTEKKDMKSHIAVFSAPDPLTIDLQDPAKIREFYSFYSAYAVTPEKSQYLKQFISTNSHCLVAKDAVCMFEDVTLPVQTLITDVTTQDERYVGSDEASIISCKKPYFVVSQSAWDKICKMAILSKRETPTPNDDLASFTAMENWKNYYLSQLHGVSRVFSKHYYSIFFSNDSPTQVQEKLKQRAAEHPGGASDKTCQYFKLK